MATIPTTAQLELMTIVQLTAFWNANCAAVQRTPIKKFTDKAQGIKRCEELATFLRAKDSKLAKIARSETTPKAEKPAKSPRLTVSGVARELILQGLDNKAVWERLQEQFKLDDGKKHYPAWYRSELRRSGKEV